MKSTMRKFRAWLTPRAFYFGRAGLLLVLKSSLKSNFGLSEIPLIQTFRKLFFLKKSDFLTMGEKKWTRVLDIFSEPRRVSRYRKGFLYPFFVYFLMHWLYFQNSSWLCFYRLSCVEKLGIGDLQTGQNEYYRFSEELPCARWYHYGK